MKRCVYYNDKPVFLADEIDPDLKELMQHPDAVFVDEISSHAINSLLHEIRKPDFHAAVLFDEDFEKLEKAFFKHFKFIEAAGGIVQNEKRDILFIFRKGRWDLPKGKMEKGEEAVACAMREIEEETGVGNLTYKNAVTDTYHIYDEFGKHFLKLSHWFYFTTIGEHELKPQLEESITEIRWFKTSEIKKPVANTYPTIKDVLREFFDAP